MVGINDDILIGGFNDWFRRRIIAYRYQVAHLSVFKALRQIAAPLLVGLAIAVVSAILGGLLPALRMGRIPVSAALREVAS